MEKIILYSGGLDSYIGYWLLHREDPSWLPVYFPLNSRYTQKERYQLERYHMSSVDNLRISGARQPILDLRSIERDDGYTPQRNVLLCAAAQARYNASDIALCSVGDDVYADNDAGFHTLMSILLTHTAGHQVRVFSPFDLTPDQAPLPNRLDKAEAVALYLAEGGNADALRQTISCYDPVEVSCGHCTACVRRREALEANGISP